MTAQSSVGAARRPGPTASPLLREDVGNIAVLTLDRPQARNSLSEAMLAALQQELDRLAGETRIRAVLLAANGPAFSDSRIASAPAPISPTAMGAKPASTAECKGEPRQRFQTCAAP